MAQVEFLTRLHLTVLSDKAFALASDFYVLLEGLELCIPEGFITDLASVPRLPFVYLALAGRGHKAAVLHDWLYRRGIYSRLQCDQYYYHGLRANGVGYFHAKAMYLGVRAGGVAYYNKVSRHADD